MCFLYVYTVNIYFQGNKENVCKVVTKTLLTSCKSLISLMIFGVTTSKIRNRRYDRA